MLKNSKQINKMKTLVFRIWILLSIASISLVYAQVEKEKKVNKKFTVNAQHVLDIKNKFGKVHINTTAKNEITVDVTVKVKRRSESKAQETLDAISIDISEDKAGNKISFVTRMDGSMNSKDGDSFEVNYLVNMPKGNPLVIVNSFGPTYLADFDGTLDLKSSYGQVKMDNLSSVEAKIKVSFGGASINSLKTADIDISYSEMDLKSAGSLVLKNSFSDISITKVGNLNITSKYGDVKLSEVDVIDGTIGFSGFELGTLNKSLKLKTQYSGDFEIKQVSKNFEFIDINAGFGEIEIGMADVAANFDVKLKFGDFDYNSANMTFKEKIRESNSSSYKGVLGKGNPTGKILITANYSDVKM